jgi:hypothetical protein
MDPTARRQTRRRRTDNNLSISGVSDLDLTSPEMGSENLPEIPLDGEWQIAESEAEAT